MEAVPGQGAAHLFQSMGEFGRGKAGAGRELAGALQLSIDGGALGPFHADGADKGARRAAEDEGHAVLLALALHLDGFIEAGGKELAQAFFQIFAVERRSLGLGKMAGQRGQAAGGNPFERDAPHRQAIPLDQEIFSSFRWRLRPLRAGSGRRSTGGGVRLLAPTGGSAADPEDEDTYQQKAAPIPIAALPRRLCLQDYISQKRGESRPVAQ